MKIYIGHVFIYSASERDICVITELRNVKMIDNVKIILNNKLLVGFLADVKAMGINCSAF